MPIVCTRNAESSDIHDVLASLGSAVGWQPTTVTTRLETERWPIPDFSPYQAGQGSEERGVPLEDRAFVALKAIYEGLEMANRPRSEEGLTEWLQEMVTVPFETVALGESFEDRNAVWLAKRSCEALEAAAKLAQRLSLIIGGQAKRVRRQVEALQLQYGISSLPDDILSDILVLVTECEDRYDDMSLTERHQERLQTAMKLLHVCSRFRLLLLDRPQVWSFLSIDISNIGMVRHCIKYSKSAPLHICVENLGSPFSTVEFETFVTECLKSAENWRHLTLQLPHFETMTEQQTACFEGMLENISSFTRLTNEYSFCSLESLEMRFNGPFAVEVDLQDEKFHPYLRWTLPSLSRLSVWGAIPIPFNNNIRDLQIFYISDRTLTLDLHQLSAFFAFCSSLEDVEIRLTDWQSIAPCEPVPIPGVKRITYDFNRCSVSVIRTVCGTLQFPEAKTMSLGLRFLRGASSDVVFSRGPHFGYGAVMSDILRCYTGLKSLHLDLSPLRIRGRLGPYLPPFPKLSGLEHLMLSASAGWELLDLREVPSGVRIPALQSLALFMELGDWPRISGWVNALIARLEQQGDLGNLSLLRIYRVQRHGRRPDAEWFQLKEEICECISVPQIRVEIMPVDV
ncbi:hypothetical protein SCHPADRAFT_997598 [Schizopora paradoxa]|uniref:Uncharacterized protein n=1 Tax=Schizopora paradoxa TaxID=27342 RepID=A0A0H2RUP7_9AGAM|nr:hypothetical protein SCHPADRAFT_997598 [Schizopora paradoxa]